MGRSQSDECLLPIPLRWTSLYFCSPPLITGAGLTVRPWRHLIKYAPFSNYASHRTETTNPQSLGRTLSFSGGIESCWRQVGDVDLPLAPAAAAPELRVASPGGRNFTKGTHGNLARFRIAWSCLPARLWDRATQGGL